jgi:hypothetical protein
MRLKAGVGEELQDLLSSAGSRRSGVSRGVHVVFAAILCTTMVLSCLGALDLVGKRVVATYVLEAQSDEYNIVPEFSSPILLPLLVLVIALALVFSTKRFPRKLLIPDLSANQEISYTDSRRDSSPLGGFEEYVACRIL